MRRGRHAPSVQPFFLHAADRGVDMGIWGHNGGVNAPRQEAPLPAPKAASYRGASSSRPRAPHGPETLDLHAPIATGHKRHAAHASINSRAGRPADDGAPRHARRYPRAIAPCSEAPRPPRQDFPRKHAKSTPVSLRDMRAMDVHLASIPQIRAPAPSSLRGASRQIASGECDNFTNVCEGFDGCAARLGLYRIAKGAYN